MELIFATSNPNKVREIQCMLSEDINISDLNSIGWSGDIAETASTLEGNAALKARAVSNAYDLACFAEDTGLEVDALNGEPGIYSARYAGPERDSAKNMHKLLDQLTNHENRAAQFRTIIAVIIDSAIFCFEGVIRGRIALEAEGDGGFGYDPIFIPDGYDQSFGELPSEIKNRISHRAIAMRKLTKFLMRYAKCKNPG